VRIQGATEKKTLHGSRDLVRLIDCLRSFGRNGLKISATALINRRPPEKSGTAGGRVVPLARCQATGGVRIPRKARRAVRVGQWRRTFHVGTVYGVSRPSTLLHTG
jgi:hypothetical protein